MLQWCLFPFLKRYLFAPPRPVRGRMPQGRGWERLGQKLGDRYSTTIASTLHSLCLSMFIAQRPKNRGRERCDTETIRSPSKRRTTFRTRNKTYSPLTLCISYASSPRCLFYSPLLTQNGKFKRLQVPPRGLRQDTDLQDNRKTRQAARRRDRGPQSQSSDSGRAQGRRRGVLVFVLVVVQQLDAGGRQSDGNVNVNVFLRLFLVGK